MSATEEQRAYTRNAIRTGGFLGEEITCFEAVLADSERLAEVEAELEQARRAAKNPWEWTDPGSPLQERAARLKAMSGNRDSLITNLERVYVAEGLWFAHEALRIEGRLAEIEKAASWALDVLDLCVRRLVTLGEPEPELYQAGRTKALSALDAVPGDTE